MKKKPAQILSPNPRDYPSNMSGYERDSLVAEAVLAAEKKMAKSAQNPRRSERQTGDKSVSTAS
jgi:hypothetical protein